MHCMPRSYNVCLHVYSLLIYDAHWKLIRFISCPAHNLFMRTIYTGIYIVILWPPEIYVVISGEGVLFWIVIVYMQFHK
jgi:hypothetical protein